MHGPKGLMPVTSVFLISIRSLQIGKSNMIDLHGSCGDEKEWCPARCLFNNHTRIGFVISIPAHRSTEVIAQCCIGLRLSRQ